MIDSRAIQLRSEPTEFPSVDSRLPLYARLRDVLAARIVAQEWKVGEVIPPEAELGKQYGLSVNTVRRSVESLVREGLLERRQGSGTYIRRPAFDASLFRWFHFTDLDRQVTVPESRLVRREIVQAPDEVAGKLSLVTGAKVLHVRRLRFWAQVPVVVEDIYLPLPLFARFKDMPESAIGPLLYPVYDREFGCLVGQVEDELSIATATSEYARLLEIPESSPVIVIDRDTMRVDGSIIEWRRARGRADRFHYKMRQR